QAAANRARRRADRESGRREFTQRPRHDGRAQPGSSDHLHLRDPRRKGRPVSAAPNRPRRRRGRHRRNRSRRAYERGSTMTMFKLAAKNFFRGGAKAWLRVVVLSLAFIVIIGLQGLYQGVAEQASHAMIDAELGGGQYWHPKYDPQNPLALADAHGPVPDMLKKLVDAGEATAILVVQGYMSSKGSLRAVLLKGIDPGQRLLSMPANVLGGGDAPAPALIGTRMASEAGLAAGDVA